MILKYITLILLNWIASFLNLFLAPIIVLFASEEGWLPKWLWWFQTPDYSLNGDDGWKDEHHPFKLEDNKFKRWVNRTAWLYRNSMYGFSEDVLGITLEEGFSYTRKGSETVGNRPLVEGLVKRKLVNGIMKEYFQWYYVKAWSPTMCLRINLGWKLWGDKFVGVKKGIVFSVNPFMGYSA